MEETNCNKKEFFSKQKIYVYDKLCYFLKS